MPSAAVAADCTYQEEHSAQFISTGGSKLSVCFGLGPKLHVRFFAFDYFIILRYRTKVFILDIKVVETFPVWYTPCMLIMSIKCLWKRVSCFED